MKYEREIMFWGVLVYLLAMLWLDVFMWAITGSLAYYYPVSDSTAAVVTTGLVILKLAIWAALGVWTFAHLYELWIEKYLLWQDDDPARLFALSIAAMGGVGWFVAVSLLVLVRDLLGVGERLIYIPFGSGYVQVEVFGGIMFIGIMILGILCSGKVHTYLLAHAPSSLPEPGA